MKKDKSNKRSTAEKAIEKSVPSAQAQVESSAAKPAGESRYVDLEREEIVQDERGENYYRKTPKGMWEDAEAEVDRRELADYQDTISLLRKKGFSFREIGEFLTKRGVFADHNAVYRVYTKFMTPEEIAAEERGREMEQ